MRHGSERANATVRLLISKNQPKFPTFTKSGQEPKKREIIRALVRRVEVGLEQVQVVFRVDSFPGESDPEKKSLQLCRGSSWTAYI
jgi:hypothetical protein